MEEVCGDESSGVDLNRNYAIDWKVEENTKKFDGNDPCGETYKGKAPFSEKESSNIRDFIDRNKENLKFVVNLHSNGNSYIWPYNGRKVNDI